MTARIGINGFGRIGRSLLRVALERPELDIELVAVNDPFGDAETMAYLLRHDSVMGPLRAEIKVHDDGFLVNGASVVKLSHTEPAEIPWGDLGVDVVVESTGVFTKRAKAARHCDGGARKVIVAYTGDQALLDVAQTSRSGKVDLRRMRAAALSIVPNTTGAAKAIGLVLPELDGRLAGMALRVPVPNGSITDLVATLQRDVSREEVNAAFAEASVDGSYRGVLRSTVEPLVSADIVGDAASCIVSAADTIALGRTVKVLGWYDNEWGYANRLAELAQWVL